MQESVTTPGDIPLRHQKDLKRRELDPRYQIKLVQLDQRAQQEKQEFKQSKDSYRDESRLRKDASSTRVIWTEKKPQRVTISVKAYYKRSVKHGLDALIILMEPDGDMLKRTLSPIGNASPTPPPPPPTPRANNGGRCQIDIYRNNTEPRSVTSLRKS